MRQSKTVAPYLIPQISHINLAIQLEDVRIADHLCIPSGSRNVNTGFAIITVPRDHIHAPRVADAVTVLFSAIMGAVTVAKKHVVFAVGVKHIRTGLRLVLLYTAGDQIFIQFCPGDAILRCRHANLVDRLSAAIHPLPFAPGNIKKLPLVIESANFWPAHHEWLIR
ncbi:TPA: hypothetical protein KWI17_002327 [Enterobacter cloacae]|nr:hypothetical protein [Enterobacter cloacae]